MDWLPTVLLEHTTGSDRHYDWLFPNPDAADPPFRLITWRVQVPPSEWPLHGAVEMIRLPDHRRIYLEYEGPLTRGRGHVRRIDSGTILPRQWSAAHAVINISMGGWHGRVTLQQITEDRWAAAMEPWSGGTR